MKNELNTGFEVYRDKSCRQMDPLFLAVQQLIVLWSTPSRPSLHCSCYSVHHCNNLDGCFLFQILLTRPESLKLFTNPTKKSLISIYSSSTWWYQKVCMFIDENQTKTLFLFPKIIDIRIKIVMISRQNKTRTKRYSSIR